MGTTPVASSGLGAVTIEPAVGAFYSEHVAQALKLAGLEVVTQSEMHVQHHDVQDLLVRVLIQASNILYVPLRTIALRRSAVSSESFGDGWLRSTVRIFASRSRS
jgi:hypothetical protein